MQKLFNFVLSKIVLLIRIVFSVKNIIRLRFFSTSLSKGLFIIGGGTALSQIIIVISLPIITRIYSPEQVGTLSAFSSLLSILIVGSAFKYEFAIPLPKKVNDAEYLLILSFCAITISGIILFIILTFFGGYIAKIFHLDILLPYIWLLLLGFFASAIYQTLTYWAIREKDYLRITQTKISQNICGSGSKIILGILSLGSFGLVLGDIIGRLVGIVTLGKIILPRIWKSIAEFNFDKIIFIAKEYKKFPLYSLPAGLINELALQVPILLLSSIFDLQIVGLYTLAYLVLIGPVSVVSSSMSQVFFSEMSHLIRDRSKQMLPFYYEITKKLFLFGAPLILLVAIISPFLLPLIFGAAWKDAGSFTLPMSIFVIAQFVISPTDRLELLGFNHWELLWNIGRTISVLFGFYLASLYKLSPNTTILIYSIIMTIMYTINFVLNIKAIKRFSEIKE
jgi:O-antigen/teichoic acid export membrane protein